MQLEGSDLFALKGGLWALQRSTHSQTVSLSIWCRKHKPGKTRAVPTSAWHPSLPAPNPTLTFSMFLCLSHLQLKLKGAITKYKASGTMACLRRSSIAHILERSSHPEYSLHLIQTNRTSYLFFFFVLPVFTSFIFHYMFIEGTLHPGHLTQAPEIEWWSREAQSWHL